MHALAHDPTRSGETPSALHELPQTLSVLGPFARSSAVIDAAVFAPPLVELRGKHDARVHQGASKAHGARHKLRFTLISLTEAMLPDVNALCITTNWPRVSRAGGFNHILIARDRVRYHHARRGPISKRGARAVGGQSGGALVMHLAAIPGPRPDLHSQAGLSRASTRGYDY
ncbi:hypothetical protein Purlil1_5410 [Purpureocillium lilacinum]|uniref:Uncharacterized protein n=1 Tax=Purpureocillium lilacinum TaxID=33203 RepID=A0ABR0C1L9_PURLI|nr:hypothetical protein Purlil1_5410 [Purpureocillium lilacinum]